MMPKRNWVIHAQKDGSTKTFYGDLKEAEAEAKRLSEKGGWAGDSHYFVDTQETLPSNYGHKKIRIHR